MHQPVGKFTRSGKDQQPAGVEVQPPDRKPFRIADRWQFLENTDTLLGVVARHNLTLGLVIQNHAWQLCGHPELDAPAAYLNQIFRGDALTDRRRLFINLHLAGLDHLLHCAS